MKLQKSLALLQDHAQLSMAMGARDKRTCKYIQEERDKYMEGGAHRDYVRMKIWTLWRSLPKLARDAVIAMSIPYDTWVGGYPDVADAHIETLLRNTYGRYVEQMLATDITSAGTDG